jgi:hypothetical protein
MSRAGLMACIGDRNAYIDLVGNSEGKKERIEDSGLKEKMISI